MEEATWKEWGRLRTRVLKGDILDEAEQQAYAQGLQRLEAEETLDDSLERLRRSRERTQELKAEYTQLQARYLEMEAEITRLEAQLDEPARQLLGIGN